LFIQHDTPFLYLFHTPQINITHGEVCDCHVKVKIKWRQAKYYRDLGTMRFSPTTKKLEAAHRVAIAKGDHDVTWLEVAEPELRRGEG
jgi:hypothetical protein